MKKRTIVLACGLCLLTAFSGCPFRTVSAAKTRIADVQPAVKLIVVAPSNAVGL